MNIAVFYSFMDNIGGAEIVSLTLARELDADLYTTNIDREKIEKMGFADVLPRIFSIGAVPLRAPFRQQMTVRRFRKLDLNKSASAAGGASKKYHRFIICGDWAMSAAVNNRPNLWYVHAPLNEIWQYKNYVKKELIVWWKRPIFELWVAFNRMLTLRYAASVDVWVANSQNTQARIKKFYAKSAAVIHPPTDTKKYFCAQTSGQPYQAGRKDYWLSVNRLVAHKRIEMQLKAFSTLPNEKLIIVGSYEKGADQFESYKKQLENMMHANVEIRHWVSVEELRTLYAECKGFITTALDEDFGMTPVEAMASGKPVIAPRQGGYPETITEKTGVLIDDIDEHKLAEAVRQMSLCLKDSAEAERIKKDCQKRAADFDTSVFIAKMKALCSKG